MRFETAQALKYGNYRLLWLGSCFSFTGRWVQMLALTWLVLELTDSPFYIGLLAAVRAVPAFIFSLYGGVLADRLNRRWLFFFTQLGELSMTLLLAILVSLGAANIAIVMAISFFWGIAFTMNNTTRQALIPQLVEKPDLLNAVALNQAIFAGGRIVGPILAGMIITRWNTATCFYINAMLMVPLVLALLPMRVSNPPPRTGSRKIFQEFGDGLRYVVSNRSIASLLLLVAIPTFFGMSYTVLIPVLARDVLGVGASGYGTLVSIEAVGALLASLGIANLGGFSRKGWLVLCVAISFGLLLIALSLSSWYPLFITLIFLAGVANSGYLTLTNTLIQLLVPDNLRGRVMSLYMLNPAVLHNLGMLYLGSLAGAVGVTLSLTASGLVVALFALGMAILVPRLRRL